MTLKKRGKKQPDGQKVKLNGVLRATGFCCESQFCEQDLDLKDTPGLVWGLCLSMPDLGHIMVYTYCILYTLLNAEKIQSYRHKTKIRSFKQRSVTDEGERRWQISQESEKLPERTAVSNGL